MIIRRYLSLTKGRGSDIRFGVLVYLFITLNVIFNTKKCI